MELNIRYNDLMAENERLKEAIDTIAVIHTKQAKELEALRKENAALRKELGNIRLLETRQRPAAPNSRKTTDCKVMSIKPQNK